MKIDSSVDISIIVPVYDEEESIGPLYEKLLKALEEQSKSWEIIFIDDGSRDKSLVHMKKIAEEEPRVRVITFVRNFGKTPAWSAGIDYARGEFIISIDADLQNDPEDIVRIIDKMEEGFDVVSGWRERRKDEFVTRLLPSWIANKIIAFVTKVPIRDFGCGLKGYRRNVIKGIHLYGEMHRFAPIYAVWLGARVTEIPVKHHARMYGVSKFGGLDRTFKVVLDLITVQFMASYFTKPIYVFGTAGLACLGVSILGLFALIFFKYFFEDSFIDTVLPISNCIFFVSGFQFILLGLMAETLMRTYHESQGKLTYVISELMNIPEAENPDTESRTNK